MTTTNPRRPLLAVVFSMIVPGLGHAYAGDFKKGLLIIGALVGVALLMGAGGVLSTFYGIAALIAIFIGFYIFSIISSVRLANRNKAYKLKSYNRWYWYLAIVLGYSIIGHTLIDIRGDVLGYELYRLSAKSMAPTLQAGELITVNTRMRLPDVGDVIVFLYPKDRRIPYVKRVVAIGGDTVSIDNGVVIRNGQPVDALQVPERVRQRDFSVSMEEKQVPENELFVLGDFRDSSNDSRFWGTVPMADVVGVVTYIWFSTDVNRIGMAVE